MYNGIGNIVSVTKRTGNSAGSTTTFGYDTTHPDRLTSFGGKAITYNANGGIASYDGWNYTWSKGKLTKISQTSGARAIKPILSPSKNYSFTYNGYGQRVGKSYSYLGLTGTIVPVETGEVTSYNKVYTYDNAGRLIAEVVNGEKYGVGSYSETLRYLYDERAIVGVQYTNGANTSTYYFLRNLQGDVIAIYDVAGAEVASYSYDAWGNCTIDSTTTNYDIAYANPIRYRGYYYDEDTKLYYLKARYYSPEFRRFISPDDTNYLDPNKINGLNLYAYCRNNPVMYYDPTGTQLWETCLTDESYDLQDQWWIYAGAKGGYVGSISGTSPGNLAAYLSLWEIFKNLFNTSKSKENKEEKEKEKKENKILQPDDAQNISEGLIEFAGTYFITSSKTSKLPGSPLPFMSFGPSGGGLFDPLCYTILNESFTGKFE